MKTKTTPFRLQGRIHLSLPGMLLSIGAAALLLVAALLHNPANHGRDSAIHLPHTGWDVNRSGYDFPQEAHDAAQTAEAGLPSLDLFIQNIAEGGSSQIHGVYVPNVLALEVGQQPANQAGYVGNQLGMVTQFRMAQRNGITGFLAHNYLSGEEFYGLWPGMPVYVVYGDGSVQNYVVTSRSPFQKLSPGNPRSKYIDLKTGEVRTTLQVFNQFYTGDHHLIFQTCLEAEGLSNWGLFFVTAVPMDEIGQARSIQPQNVLEPH